MNNSNRGLKKGYIAASVSLILSTHIVAQEQNDGVIKKEDTGLEIIMVTAQKRSQNLQNVPIAVTAISGNALAEAAIKDMFDLQASVPSLTISQSQSSTTPQFSIRGVGTSSQNFGLESSVGMYVDGVYRARQSSMINNFVDVEVVEVLRGPQGTLFGKNTPSGAIQIRNVAPSHDGNDGFIEATLGNYGLKNVSFAKSFSAIEDELAFRVTAFSSDRDGYISDINLGNDVIDNRERFGGRIQALYTPNSDVTVRVIADYAEIDESCCAAFTSVSNAQASDIPGKFGTDAVISRAPFNANLVTLNQFSDPTVAISFLPESKLKDSGLSVQVDWDINEQLTLVSLSASRNFDTYDFSDVDMTELDLLSRSNDSTQSSFSQELRLDYNGNDLHATGGFFYFTQDLDNKLNTNVGSDFNDFALQAVFGGNFNSLLQGINGISAMTGGLVPPSAKAIAESTYSANSKQDHKSWAVFSQFDYQFTEELTVTFGLRYTDEEKQMVNQFPFSYASGNTQPTDISSIGNPAYPASIVPGSLIYTSAVAGQALQGIAAGAIPLGTPQFLQAIQTFAPFQQEGWLNQSFNVLSAIRPDADESLEDEQITGTFKLSWQADNDTLLYASYGTGYKSGGTNTDKIAIDLDPLFDSETSNAFEIGMKRDFPDIGLRINAAAHHTITKDFQASAFIGTNFSLQNAGDYKATGIEVESLWVPVEGTKIKLTYSYIDATYDEFDKGPCWSITPWHKGVADPGQVLLENGTPALYCDRAGDRPFGQPKVIASLGLQQVFKISDDVYSYAMIEYNYLGSMYTEAANDPISKADGYGKINARIYFSFTEYDTDIILWGRNITDKDNQGLISYAAPLQSAKLLSFYSEPATYGITVKTRF
jgi:iron complex outermembrane receptor protein